MKILIATDCYIFNMNGVTTCVLALCSALRRCGHEVRPLFRQKERVPFAIVPILICAVLWAVCKIMEES